MTSHLHTKIKRLLSRCSYYLFTVIFILFFTIAGFSQNGYIYVHKKTINETSSLDFPFTLKNNSGNTLNTFILNDKADNYINVYDIGAGHGNGAGSIWAIAGTSNSGVNNTGTIYMRQAGSSNWTAVSGIVGSPSAIDGAYQNQCVYINGGRVYFYNNGVSTVIYNSTNATDVAAANGRIVITIGGTAVYRWNGAYDETGITTASTSWTTRSVTGNAERIDLDATGNNIVYINNTSGASVYTIGYTSGSAVSLGLSDNNARPGSTNTPGNRDVAWSDDGTIYATGATTVMGGSDIVYSYSSGTWTSEPEARGIQRITGGPGGQTWGLANLGSGFAQAIWARTNDGTHQWIDDERVKNSSGLYGNSTMIEVPAGVYKLSEAIPNATWDLGRFNIYDPTNNTTGDNMTRVATINVSAGEVVHVEYINELLIPKAIELNCNSQYLQSFDAGSGTGKFGNGTYGTYVEGTSYHYFAATSPQDGYYTLLKSLNSQWFVSNTPNLTDHTGNGGYFMLVNASYGRDEFYRQRITNLVPGVKYSISFWAADALGANPIRPNISFGMQDLSGNIYTSSSSGDIYPTTAGTNTAVWRNYTLIFTQPAGITTADMYIKNNNIGGLGNDLAIDDITLNPVLESGYSNIVPPILCTAPFPYDYTITNPQPGGYWTSSNPSVASVNPTTGVLTSGLNAGTALITYYLTNPLGCITTATSNIEVFESPRTTATANTTAACVGQSISLSAVGSGGLAPYSYSWSAIPSGSGGIANAGAQNTTASPTASGSYKYVNLITDSKGCKGSDTATVVISTGVAPSVTAFANPVNNASGYICSGVNTVNLSATPSPAGAYTYTWSGDGITNASSQNTTAFPTTTGNFTVTVVNSQGCFASANTSSVTVWPNPAVDPQSNFPAACRNQTVNLYSNRTGGTTSISYQWTSAPSNSIFSSATNANPTVTYPSGASGTYTYNLTVSDARGCTASGSTQVVISNNTATPSVSNLTASPSTVCLGSDITLSAQRNSGSNGNYTYTWSGDGISTTNTTTTGSNRNTSITATPTVASSSSYTVVVTNSSGCSASRSVSVTVRNLPTVSLNTNTSNGCENADITLTANVTGTTSGNYTYAWTGTGLSNTSTGPTGSITSTNTATLTTAGNYTYAVSVTDGYGCTSASGAASTVAVSIGSYPVISNIAVSNSNPCVNSTITLTPTISGGSVPYSYFWSGSTGSGLNNNNTGTTTANPTVDANYALFIIDKNGCTATKQTSTILLKPTPKITPQISQNTVCSGTSVSLTSTVTGGTGTYSSFLWTKTAGGTMSPTNTQNTTASPTSSGTYTVSVTDANGCNAIGQVAVAVNPIPTVSSTGSAQTRCSGSAMSTMVLSGTVSGTTFSWTRDNGTLTTGPVKGIAASGTGNISGTPVNTTSAPVVVTFTITPTANGCTGNPITTKLTVNPNISVVLSGTQSICVNAAATLTLTSAGPFPFNVTLSNGVSYPVTSSPTYVIVNPTSNTTYSISSLSVTSCASGGGMSGTAIVSIPTASQPVGTWVCGVDQDWFNPCNWGQGVVPDNSINVTIPNSASCSPVINPLSSYAPPDKIARSKNITIANAQNVSFTNGGNLYVAGNWNNNRGPAGFTANTGTVTFMGSTPQSINTTTGNSEAFYGLTINNTSHAQAAVILDNSATVSGMLTLTDGIVKTTSTKLLSVINPVTAAVVGGSLQSYIWGPIARNTNNTGDYLYPVGRPGAPYTEYRPAITAPANGIASTYQVEYLNTPSPASLSNKGGNLTGILKTEHWQIDRVTGTADAVIKLPYINPKNNGHWDIGNSPCNSCNVAITTPFQAYSDYWYFTNGINFGSGFDNSLPETRYYANDGIIYSKLMATFGDFTFGYAYNTILPVRLISFNAKPDGNNAMLEWVIDNAADLDQFEIQVSKDGRYFTSLANEHGFGGQTAYRFKQPGLAAGNYYYRIVVRDKTGSSFYSKTVALTINKSGTIISGLSPTLVKSETFMTIISSGSQTVYTTVYDMAGRILGRSSYKIGEGKNKIGINTMALSKGIYNMQVITTDGTQASLRFMKE